MEDFFFLFLFYIIFFLFLRFLGSTSQTLINGESTVYIYN